MNCQLPIAKICRLMCSSFKQVSNVNYVQYAQLLLSMLFSVTYYLKLHHALRKLFFYQVLSLLYNVQTIDLTFVGET